MKSPFTTSFGTFQEKDFLILEVKDELGNTGWGESVAFSTPWYTEETLGTNLHMIKDFLNPYRFRKGNRTSRRSKSIIRYNPQKQYGEVSC